MRNGLLFFLGSLTLLARVAGAEEVKWLWHRPGAVSPETTQTVFLRKTFVLPGGKIESAELKVAADDAAWVSLNGEKLEEEMSVRRRPDEEGPRYRAERREVIKWLRPGGQNVIAAEARNRGGPAGFLLELTVRMEDGERIQIVSDDSWMAGDVEGEEAVAAVVIGEEGDNPWFEVLNAPTVAAGESIRLPEGFRAEVVRIAKADEDTWVSMTVDSKRRLIVGAQHFPSEAWGGLIRFTLGEDGGIAKEERIALPVGAAQGLLYAHDSLYVQGEGPEGPGIYRVRDRDGDDEYEEVDFLKEVFNRGGSHGPHGLALGPDGWIYHVAGDYSSPVEGIDRESSPYRNYAEDLLLPRRWDASGHGRGVMAPCGTVQRFTPDGKRWELFCGGMRNPYGIAFNEEGELFTYDADMEYDIGLPWYRATRVYHLVAGGDYGHREGTGKWPYYYPDSLPPVTVVGIGSPCGVQFGYRSHFPAKYREALFLCDWAYGKVFAVHLEEKGASYAGEVEVFAEGRPLNAMEIAFGPEGSMYLITGGNDSQAALYRIFHEKPEAPPLPVPGSGFRVEEKKELRRRIEAGEFDGGEELWSLLGDDDRFVRYAARIALERGEVNAWRERALGLREGRALMGAMLALGRCGESEDLPRVLEALERLEWGSLSREERLDWLRVYEVAFARLGAPGAEEREDLIARLDAIYPAGDDFDLNRELSRLLVFLEAPSVAGKTLALVEKAKTQEEEIHYITALRNVKRGWTLEERKAYFGWFEKAAAEYSGGVSFYKYLANFKQDAIAAQTAGGLSEAERAALEPWLAEFPAPEPILPSKPMEFVRAWTMRDLESRLSEVGKGRDFAKGKAAFRNAMCAACHRVFDEGGVVGPDLSAVASRFSRRDILEAIVDPSSTVMAQYAGTMVTKTDGTVVVGQLVEETEEALTLVTDAIAGTRVMIPLKEVKKQEVSPVSPMPSGTINVLSAEEVLDLLAYLEAGGSQGAAVYGK